MPFEEVRATRGGHEVSIQCLRYSTKKNRIFGRDPLHYHDYIEILFMLSGNADVLSSGRKLRFSTGDLVVINSREAHGVETLTAAEYIVVKLKPQILYSSDFSLVEAQYMIPFVVSDNPIKIFRNEDFAAFDIRALMESIHTEWEGAEAGYEMLMRADLLRLFTWIIRHRKRTGEDDYEKLDFPGTSAHAVQRLINLALEGNRDLSCAEAAESCNMSYSYFSRVFKRFTGMSYTAYLMNLRINRADRMLATTDATITEIAAAAGFSSDAYFIKCFKSTKGITPGQYRIKLAELSRTDA